MTLLLANIALAGAFHFFLPGDPSASRPEMPPAPRTGKTAVNHRREVIPTVPVSARETKPSDPGQLRAWIAGDPGGAVDWAAHQPAGKDRDAVLEAACYEIANQNPAAAVALAEKYALTNHATLANLTQQWARRDLDAACAWVQAEPAGDERNALAARVGYVWSASDPAAAATFVVEEIPPGPVQTEAAISVLHQWAMQDFDGAMAWTEQFPDGEIRQRAISELAGIRDFTLAKESFGEQSSPPGK